MKIRSTLLTLSLTLVGCGGAKLRANDSKPTPDGGSDTASRSKTTDPASPKTGSSDQNSEVGKPEKKPENNDVLKETAVALPAVALAGCWKDVPLQKLEILVGGTKAGNAGAIEIDSSATSQRQGAGNAEVYTFALNSDLELNASNAGGALFKSDGFISSTDFSNKSAKIGDIRYLNIKKQGFSYDNHSFTQSGNGFFGIGGYSNIRFKIFETNAAYLSTIQILANNQLVYSRSEINHTFRKDSLQFIDVNFENNKSWQLFNSRSDCK